MGVPQSKQSYVYNPKKKLRRKTLYNSILEEKPEHLVYDDIIHNSVDDHSKYNTTKSYMDIRDIQKRKDQLRPLSLDEEMLERPESNISNLMHQYRQEVANQIAKIAPLGGENASSKSQGSSDGFKDVYDDDYYDKQMGSSNFEDAMSYHSLDFDTTRPTEFEGAVRKLNKSAEFEFARVGSKKLGRRSSIRRDKGDKPPETSTSSEHNIKPVTPSILQPEVIIPTKTALPVLELSQSAPIETVRQLSNESTLDEPVTPQEIITLEEVNDILQDIKDKILQSEINDTEVYHQLLMCKKKAQGIYVTSIKIRAKKTMLIGKINKFVHWFAISEPNAQDGLKNNKENQVLPNTDKADTKEEENKNGLYENVDSTQTKMEYKNDHEKNVFKPSDEVTSDAETNNEGDTDSDARAIFIVNTIKDQQAVPDVVDGIICTEETILDATYYNLTKKNEISVQTDTEDVQRYGNNTRFLERETHEHGPPIVESINPRLQNINIGSNSSDQEDEPYSTETTPLNVYEEVNNIRMLLQEVHSKMDAFTGRRYDVGYYDIIDQVSHAKLMLDKVKDTQLLEVTLIEDYEKFFEDLLFYFDGLIERNVNIYDNVVEDDEEATNSNKTVHFEEYSNLNQSKYYINGNNQLNFEFKNATNLSECEDERSTQFVSLTEYDGNVIEACETFNKAVEFHGDEGHLSPDDDFIFKTNAAGQIVFEHEENNKPYIVDPISFSKCRMRPLSIIQEQLDEFLDCHVAAHQEKPFGQDDENEDRDDWDSFDENMMGKNKEVVGAEDEYDEIKEFEQIERNISNVYENFGKHVQNSNHISQERIDIHDHGFQNRTNFKELTPEFNYSAIEPVQENCIKTTNDELVGNFTANKNITENLDTNGFYSLETQSVHASEEQDSTDKIKYKNYLVETIKSIKKNDPISNQDKEDETEKRLEDLQKEEISPTPIVKSPLEYCESMGNEEILNLTNYKFDSKELLSYNEIMKINSTIDSLQSQIDRFSGTAASPDYMLTYKQIFDNMRTLNNIDNCNYQEEILNLIDYTSDKIQKCIFELGLKVS